LQKHNQFLKISVFGVVSVNLESVRCKNRIFPKNPVFLHTSTHKIKLDKAAG